MTKAIVMLLHRVEDNMCSRVLAIDPGGTTGLAWYNGLSIETAHIEGLRSGNTPLVYQVIEQGWDHVIIERFATSGRLSGPGLYTIELVGACRGICHAHGVPLTVEAPQVRWPWQATADALCQGHVIHERDALAHLLCWLSHHERSVLTNRGIKMLGDKKHGTVSNPRSQSAR